jgi:N-sulfoglucosamine sulfohydrolase
MKAPAMKYLKATPIFACLFVAFSAAGTAAESPQPNIVFITADDMNFDSAGVYGCAVEDLTPNLDRLAREGMFFRYAYSTVTVCQPVRQTMHTGLYPHRSGSVGNGHPIKPDVVTLNERLHEAGYLISMMGKLPHYQPESKFCLDFTVTGRIDGIQVNRSAEIMGSKTREFLAMAKEQGKPFFHNVNLSDPHRGFIGAGGPDDLAYGTAPSRFVRPEEITVLPGFLEDIAEVRDEVAQYYTSVRRLDDCVGAVLKQLDESGAADNTLVMFYGGDHGMALPFAKSNMYENSTRGALILRWRGVIEPGGEDSTHLVSTLDFTPTLLEAADVEPIRGIDGRSFLSAMKGEKLDGWDTVFTFYNKQGLSNWIPMRAIRTRTEAYIWNPWSDGEKQYRAENMAGLTWKAMLAAGESDPEIKARCDFYLYRVPEEFYDLSNDRNERANLIDSPERRTEIDALRSRLLAEMRRTGDPLAEAFAGREQPEILASAMDQLAEEYPQPGLAHKRERPAPRKPQAGAGKTDLIVLELPAVLEGGKPAVLKIRHRFPEDMGRQILTVTLKSGDRRLARQTVEAAGEGVVDVVFTLPADLAGQAVSFAAFVGKSFPNTPQMIQGRPQPVE